jgi:hypothetical protein
MAEVNPPLYVPVSGVYGSDELGLPYRDLVGEGVGGTGHLLVTDGAVGLQIQVAAGFCYIRGDQSADAQPTYRCRNDGPVTLTCQTADGSNPRIDRVIAEVVDTTFGGGLNEWRLRIVTGTPAASPVPPAEPPSAITLALVTVPAGASTLSPSNIADARPTALIGAGSLGLNVPPPGPKISYTGGTFTPPASPATGDIWRVAVNDGASWKAWEFMWEGGSISKWVFTGGAPIGAKQDASTQLTGTSYGNGSGPVVSVTVPRAGRYRIRHGYGKVQTTGVEAIASLSINGGAPSDADAASTGVSGSVTVAGGGSIPVEKDIAGAHSVAQQYRTNAAGGTGTWERRWIEILPIWVNP